jgi:hypothetical protein
MQKFFILTFHSLSLIYERKGRMKIVKKKESWQIVIFQWWNSSFLMSTGFIRWERFDSDGFFYKHILKSISGFI